MGATARELAVGIAPRVAEAVTGGGRHLVAVAGPPASGKSTLASELVDALVERGLSAVMVPMDGFHLDNSVLTARGLLPRKGAAETFDAAGFVAAMERVKAGGEVILPSFDRSLEKSIAGSIVVPADADVVVVEGNYLLLDQGAWAALSALWSISVFLEVDEQELERRLMQRWRYYGYSDEDAMRKARGNDMVNARVVAATAGRADLVVHE